MKSFFVRLVNLAVIVAVLIGYNVTLAVREKDEEIARLNAELESVQIGSQTISSEEETVLGKYKDGTFTGEAEGFGGSISVEVMIKKGRLEKIHILSAAHEDDAYLQMAQEIIPEMVEAQSAKVDAISGATFSSTGIKEAVAQALKKAEQ